MATETVSPSSLVLTEERHDLAREATYELDALRSTIGDLCSDLGTTEASPADLKLLQLKIRGLTARMSQLTSVLMSVLDDDDETPNLTRKVHGAAVAT